MPGVFDALLPGGSGGAGQGSKMLSFAEGPEAYANLNQDQLALALDRYANPSKYGQWNETPGGDRVWNESSFNIPTIDGYTLEAYDDGLRLNRGGRWTDHYDASSGKWKDRTLGDSAWVQFRDGIVTPAAMSALGYFGASALSGAAAGTGSAAAGTGAASGMSGAELAAFMEANAGAMAPGAGWSGAAASTGLAPSTLALDVGSLAPIEYGAMTPEALAGGGWTAGEVPAGLSGASAGVGSSAGSTAQSSLTKSLMYGSEAAYGTGMSGAQTSIFDGVLQATGSSQLASGAAQIAGAGGDWTNWLKTAWDGAGEFLNSGMGKALVTGAGLAAVKNAKQGPADPMLKEGASGISDVAKDAKDRAAADDATWNSTFAGRYLGLMDRADRRDQELYDFNMARARLAAGQMDKFYAGVDAYDNEGTREKLVGQAGATSEQNTSAMLGQLRRGLGRSGVNPNSGAWLSQMRQVGQQGALDKTMAMNLTREAARREGLNMRATAAGLRGADATYAGGAAAGSDIGMRGVAAGNNAFSNNSANWRANQNLALGGYGQLGGWGLSRSNSADQLSAANTAGWNGLIGYGLGRMWGG